MYVHVIRFEVKHRSKEKIESGVRDWGESNIQEMKSCSKDKSEDSRSKQARKNALGTKAVQLAGRKAESLPTEEVAPQEPSSAKGEAEVKGQRLRRSAARCSGPRRNRGNGATRAQV